MERVTPGQRPRPNYGHPQVGRGITLIVLLRTSTSRTPEGFPLRSRVAARPIWSTSLSVLACYGWMLAKPSVVRQMADAGTVRIKSMRS